ncbi:tRNA pseudouridine55 synthase [Thermosipho japonicus]|uniref:tRNA pseudouridine synthase B n=1 Tax=Thermosipho japonicus TaxID=90323 RepID=A0A841GES1_9BACT|nr:tRNA pseudouridine(55) synthase TruB [Thermosipho japonicus]MBB6062126.1 tRNA pseudouridine55 synthase [Thermosipho japonicus]
MVGFLNAFKPKGVTSHDVIDELRKKLKIKKIGHAGTLDPFAEGVLVIGISGATRLLEYLKNEKKRYYVKAILGLITETFDITGQVKEERVCQKSYDEIKDAILSFKGRYKQVPPAYSAKKYNGERLYKLAREGKIISLPPVEVEIYEIENIKINPPEFSFEVVVSPGTYIRSLCMDIGYKLGCGATAVELVRKSVGKFSIEDSINPFELSSEQIVNRILRVEKVLDLPQVEVYKDYVEKIFNGVQPTMDFVKEIRDDFKKDQDVMLICDGRLVAIAISQRTSGFLKKNEVRGSVFKLKKVFREGMF